MSWSDTIYVRFADEASARAMAEQLGVDFPQDGSIPTGNGNFALKAPIVEWVRRPVVERQGEAMVTIDAGEAFDGYRAMLRLNTDWPGYEAALAALAPFDCTAEILGTPEAPRVPDNVFA